MNAAARQTGRMPVSWRLAFVALLASAPVACVVQTEHLTGPPGEPGPPGETGSPGDDAADIWQIQDDGAVYYTDGNVGIGTSKPTAVISIRGATAPTMDVSPDAPTDGASVRAANAGGDVRFGVDSIAGGTLFLNQPPFSGAIGTTNNTELCLATKNTVRMTVDAAGNVGIGTTAPEERLQVTAGNILLDHGHGIASRNTAGSTESLIFADGSDLVRVGAPTVWDGISFYAGAGEIVRIASNGNVGIGTTAPEERLQVAAGNILLDHGHGITSRNTAGSIESLIFADGNDLIRVGAPMVWDGITFYSGAGETMRIASNGNVGIGTTTPLADTGAKGVEVAGGASVMVAVNATSVSSIQLALNSQPSWELATGYPASDALCFYNYHYDPHHCSAVLRGTGELGIGTLQPMATLDINGTARLKPHSTPPVTCDSAHAGTIALNSQYVMCICTGTTWKHPDGLNECLQW